MLPIKFSNCEQKSGHHVGAEQWIIWGYTESATTNKWRHCQGRDVVLPDKNSTNYRKTPLVALRWGKYAPPINRSITHRYLRKYCTLTEYFDQRLVSLRALGSWSELIKCLRNGILVIGIQKSIKIKLNSVALQIRSSDRGIEMSITKSCPYFGLQIMRVYAHFRKLQYVAHHPTSATQLRNTWLFHSIILSTGTFKFQMYDLQMSVQFR